MFNSIVKLIVGDIEEKRSYNQEHKIFKNRIKSLPQDYRFIFNKITHYLLINGISSDSDRSLFTNLLDFFEMSSVQGKGAIEIIGTDVIGFCNELMNQASTRNKMHVQTRKNALNQSILETLKKEG